MTSALLSAAQVLNDDTVTPGLLGLGVVASLGVATWLLIRSLNRQLKKINFDDGSQPAKPAKPDGQEAEHADTNPPVPPG
jgi:hypothetical protein